MPGRDMGKVATLKANVLWFYVPPGTAYKRNSLPTLTNLAITVYDKLNKNTSFL